MITTSEKSDKKTFKKLPKPVREIPRQLMNDDVKFVPLLSNQKMPTSSGENWNKKPMPLDKFVKWIGKYGNNNYGVVCGYGNIIVVDTDSKELTDFAFKHLPETFTVKTPNKGYHFYFYIDEVITKRPLSKRIEGKNVSFGDLIGKGGYVVGPNSTLEEGRVYEVVKDVVITKLTKETLLNILVDYVPESRPTDKQIDITSYTGKPYVLAKGGAVKSLNQTYWSELYNLENHNIFIPETKDLYQYDSICGLWRIIDDGYVRSGLLKRMEESYDENSPRNFLESRNQGALEGILKQVKDGCIKQDDPFEKDNTIIHVKNGVLKINPDKSIDFRTFSPEFYSRNQLPIDFNPSAKCPRFINELLRPIMSEEDIELLQKYVGMCISGKNVTKKILILVGDRDLGKSVIVNVIAYIVGLVNTATLDTEHLGNRFEIYNFVAKTLLFGQDIKKNFLSTKGATQLKSLVGRDLVRVEKKHSGKSMVIRGDFNIILTTNHDLTLDFESRADVGAWETRLVVVNVAGAEPKKKIVDFEGVLIREEGSGILNWAIQGLVKLQKDLDDGLGFALSANQTLVVDKLIEKSDPLGHFIKTYVVSCPNNKLTTQDIIYAYERYSTNCGYVSPWNSLSQDPRVLGKEISKLIKAKFGDCSYRTNSSRGYRDIKILDSSKPEEELFND